MTTTSGTAPNLSHLEGLPISELIDRFPRVPMKNPPSSFKDGKEESLSSSTTYSEPGMKSNSQELRDESAEDPLSPVVERNYEDLLKRATKGVISSKEQAVLFNYLLTLSGNEFMALQNKVHDAMTLRNPMLKAKGPNLSALIGLDKGFPMIDVPRYLIDFGAKTCPLNVEVTDKISLTAKSGKIKYTFILPTKDPRFELKANPITGKLKNGKPPREEIIFSIICKTTVHAKCVVILDIEGGYRHFFAINVKSEPSMFGVAISEMESKEDAVFPGCTAYKVPTILIQLRNYLIEKRGLEEEGIFRQAGDESETANVKNKLNKGQFKDTTDIHSISSLIKVWFRELPLPVLNDLPPSVILQSEEEEKCLEEFEKYVKEPNKSVALWLFDMMVEAALLEEKNKMNARSLSIVIGPNLFHSAESAQLSALESLRLSQQIVSFVFHILNNRLKMHKKRLGKE